LDKVVTSEISKFEQKFLEFLRANHPKILEDIRTTGELSKANDAELKNIIETWLPESGLQMKS